MPMGLGGRIEAVERRVDAHDRRIGQLEVDMSEIRGFLGQTATKADVADMGARIMTAINGLLRDALNAMPVRQAAIWGAVVAIATIGMLLVTLLPR